MKKDPYRVITDRRREQYLLNEATALKSRRTMMTFRVVFWGVLALASLYVMVLVAPAMSVAAAEIVFSIVCTVAGGGMLFVAGCNVYMLIAKYREVLKVHVRATREGVRESE